MKKKTKPKPLPAKVWRKTRTTKLDAMIAAAKAREDAERVWVRRDQTKLGFWLPAKLLARLYHLADIKCRTKTAELIAAVEGHLERHDQ